jgi:hypothetical protein
MNRREPPETRCDPAVRTHSRASPETRTSDSGQRACAENALPVRF